MKTVDKSNTIKEYVARFEMDSFLNQDLLDALEHFQFPIYSHIYIEQDVQHYLYFLVEGQVQCSHYRLDGELAVFAISKPFTAIGDFEIFETQRVKSNVIALQPTNMLGIPRTVVERYGGDDPRFLHFLLNQTRQKLYNSNQLQQSQTLPVINRVAYFTLAHISEGQSATLPDKDVLASLLGTTVRHLNRVLKKLVEDGAISDTYPRVQILNYAMLEALIV